MITNAIFHHIGIATEYIEKTGEIMRQMFNMQAVISDEIIIDLKQNVKLLFLAGKDSSLFELVEPIDDISPVKNILSKVGVSAYHFCYEVPNLEESIHVLALLTIYRF